MALASIEKVVVGKSSYLRTYFFLIVNPILLLLTHDHKVLLILDGGLFKFRFKFFIFYFFKDMSYVNEL